MNARGREDDSKGLKALPGMICSLPVLAAREFHERAPDHVFSGSGRVGKGKSTTCWYEFSRAFSFLCQAMLSAMWEFEAKVHLLF